MRRWQWYAMLVQHDVNAGSFLWVNALSDWTQRRQEKLQNGRLTHRNHYIEQNDPLPGAYALSCGCGGYLSVRLSQENYAVFAVSR